MSTQIESPTGAAKSAKTPPPVAHEAGGRRRAVTRSAYAAHVRAMAQLGLLGEQEVRLLTAWRTGNAAVISQLLTECLQAAAAKEAA